MPEIMSLLKNLLLNKVVSQQQQYAMPQQDQMEGDKDMLAKIISDKYSQPDGYTGYAAGLKPKTNLLPTLPSIIPNSKNIPVIKITPPPESKYYPNPSKSNNNINTQGSSPNEDTTGDTGEGGGPTTKPPIVINKYSIPKSPTLIPKSREQLLDMKRKNIPTGEKAVDDMNLATLEAYLSKDNTALRNGGSKIIADIIKPAPIFAKTEEQKTEVGEQPTEDKTQSEIEPTQDKSVQPKKITSDDIFKEATDLRIADLLKKMDKPITTSLMDVTESFNKSKGGGWVKGLTALSSFLDTSKGKTLMGGIAGLLGAKDLQTEFTREANKAEALEAELTKKEATPVQKLEALTKLREQFNPTSKLNQVMGTRQMVDLTFKNGKGLTPQQQALYKEQQETTDYKEDRPVPTSIATQFMNSYTLEKRYDLINESKQVQANLDKDVSAFRSVLERNTNFAKLSDQDKFDAIKAFRDGNISLDQLLIKYKIKLNEIDYQKAKEIENIVYQSKVNEERAKRENARLTVAETGPFNKELKGLTDTIGLRKSLEKISNKLPRSYWGIAWNQLVASKYINDVDLQQISKEISDMFVSIKTNLGDTGALSNQDIARIEKIAGGPLLETGEASMRFYNYLIDKTISHLKTQIESFKSIDKDTSGLENQLKGVIKLHISKDAYNSSTNKTPTTNTRTGMYNGKPVISTDGGKTWQYK